MNDLSKVIDGIFKGLTPQQKTFGLARQEILEGIAKRLGKEVFKLEPWVDYDPITIDEDAHHIASGSKFPRYTGD